MLPFCFPVDGAWSQWSAYSKCRARQCSKGFRVRSRRCTSPRPENGGRRCRGKRWERKDCFNYDGCPQNGMWCSWSEWNSCLSSCGEIPSVRGRQRHCACPQSENGGVECEGESLEIEECRDTPPCTGSGETEKLRAEISDQNDSQPDRLSFEIAMGPEEGPETTRASQVIAETPSLVRHGHHPTERTAAAAQVQHPRERTAAAAQVQHPRERTAATAQVQHPTDRTATAQVQHPRERTAAPQAHSRESMDEDAPRYTMEKTT
ncbi:hypothetical protein EGW08_015775 [Elysia chlorotica]|uniref:EGF-like domain-containing protein n=1 Tax=Elysia chlorotica TaxID=188477 RepID=A0A433T4K5_ELYCH|nr:hypothetical protein EGW08_015775 [Elysia chlorotica]